MYKLISIAALVFLLNLGTAYAGVECLKVTDYIEDIKHGKGPGQTEPIPTLKIIMKIQGEQAVKFATASGFPTPENIGSVTFAAAYDQYPNRTFGIPSATGENIDCTISLNGTIATERGTAAYGAFANALLKNYLAALGIDSTLIGQQEI